MAGTPPVEANGDADSRNGNLAVAKRRATGQSPMRPPRHRPKSLARTASTGDELQAEPEPVPKPNSSPVPLLSPQRMRAASTGCNVPVYPSGSVSSRSLVDITTASADPSVRSSAPHPAASSTAASPMNIPGKSASSRSLTDIPISPTTSTSTSGSPAMGATCAPSAPLPPISLEALTPEGEAFFSPPASPCFMDLDPGVGARAQSASAGMMLSSRRMSEAPAMSPHADRSAKQHADSPSVQPPSPPMASTPNTASPAVNIVDARPEAAGQQPPTNDKEPLWQQYVREVTNPGPTVASADAVWGATERDVMYNSLIFVPYQLERVMWFGLLICIDPFLAIFTTVPLRAAKGVADGVRKLAWRMRSPGTAGNGAGPLLRGDQLYDILFTAIFAFAALVVSSLNAGVIYFWMKDLSQEFIKLSVIFTAMEICDKILTSFGVSALHSLCCSCTQYAAGGPGAPGLNVAVDTLVAAIITTAHAVALMSEAIAFSVAMNSRRTTLMALVISFNFVEVKGTVFKKFDPNKLMTIVYQDIVERFHMVILMLFVIIEDMDTSDSWGALNGQLMLQVGVILASELVADITKHAVVGKFNVIRPGVYREYMRDMCAEAAIAQPTSMNRVVQMEPIGTAAVCFRMLLSFLWHCLEGLEGKSWWEGVALWVSFAAAYGALVLLKLGWGFVIKLFASSYLVYYEGRFGKGKHSSAAAQSRQMGAAKKDN